jgi:hypothetical protein
MITTGIIVWIALRYGNLCKSIHLTLAPSLDLASDARDLMYEIADIAQEADIKGITTYLIIDGATKGHDDFVPLPDGDILWCEHLGSPGHIRDRVCAGSLVDAAADAIGRYVDELLPYAGLDGALQKNLEHKIKGGTKMQKDFEAHAYIDLDGGSFTAEALQCYGGSRIVFQGIYWDAETETETEAELEVLLRDSVEDLLHGWEEATAEEIQEAAAHSWIEHRVVL